MLVSGRLVDVFKGEIYPAEIVFGRRICSVRRVESAPERYILPGLVDGHIHIESSLLIPSTFARAALRHGTVAVVADPHEIANVLGVRGVEFMIRNSKKSPLKFFFGASPCVPATVFETPGASLGPREIRRLLEKREVTHLAEVMNYPDVIARKKGIMQKIALAKRQCKRIDGHAPGLGGDELDGYISAGIETDHECSALDEAKEKMRKGMIIQVREGSAAKNLNALHPILSSGRNMICVDDTDPRDLLGGHLDALLKSCVRLGVSPMDAIRSCTKNPIEHYKLPAGLLREGDPADFVIMKDLKGFGVLETWIGGRRVFANGKVSIPRVKAPNPMNVFNARRIAPEDIRLDAGMRFAIGAKDGELLTGKLEVSGMLPDAQRDLLKIVVINRYRPGKPAVGLISGFGIRNGAIGTSVMHDSHNIGVVGSDDRSICRVANRIIAMKGGLAACCGTMKSLPLPYAGLMTSWPCEKTASRLEELLAIARSAGCRMKSPFMTLSFMGLLVIPHIKMSDRGLFDGDRFRFIR